MGTDDGEHLDGLTPGDGVGSISDDIHKSVSRLLLASCQTEFNDLCATWRDIERKAQGTIAIAGIFLAGTFALLGVISKPPSEARVLIAEAIGLLLLSVFFAIRALWVSEVEALEDCGTIRRAAQAVLRSQADEQAKSELRHFVADRAEHLEKVNHDLGVANFRKARAVRWAQTSLAGAILILGGLMAWAALASWALSD